MPSTTHAMISTDFVQLRSAMVEQQVRPWDVLDVRVLDAMTHVPRERFVAEAYRALAYADLGLPIGHGEVMMKPVVEGRMLQAMNVLATDEVLEIGTGSGYISACLGRLARNVLSIERHRELADNARAQLATSGIDCSNVKVETADAMRWDSARRFDVVCVTGAVDTLPPRFLKWLKPGGRLFVVRGRAPAMEAVLLQADAEGVHTTTSLFETELPYLAGAAPVPAFHL